MNFEEWFKKYYNNTISDYDEYLVVESEKAWKACKSEILKILKGKEDYIGSGIKMAIKEIEKL